MGSARKGRGNRTTARVKALQATGVSSKHMRAEKLIHGHLTLSQRLGKGKGSVFVVGRGGWVKGVTVDF
ncbi:MAG: hypothetical protein AAF468_20415 [Pseudomonadota bacterium]